MFGRERTARRIIKRLADLVDHYEVFGDPQAEKKLGYKESVADWLRTQAEK